MRKKMIVIIGLATVVMGGAAWGVLREMGASPSAEEMKAYEKLAYFKDGEFQSPQKMIYDFDNVRNGPAGWSRFLFRSPFAPQKELPAVRLKKTDFAKQPAEYAFYWLGHSSAIMELAGKRIIFDPVFDNAAPLPLAVPRYGQAPVSREELPEIDYVVISHNHYDHLERKSVQALRNSHFIVPLGIGVALRGWGVAPENITELGWGDVFEKDGIKITAETAVHYSGRGLRDRNKTLWNSYVIKAAGRNIYWAGDSGYGEHFKKIGVQYGPFDLAALEIDGWNTGWPNTHMFPEEAVRAAVDLKAKYVLPVHWAVFDLALHPWHESIDMLLEQAEKLQVNILTPMMGEKVTPGETSTKNWWRRD